MSNCVSHPGIVSTRLRSSRAAEPSGAADRTVASGTGFVHGVAPPHTPVTLSMALMDPMVALVIGAATPGAGNRHTDLPMRQLSSAVRLRLQGRTQRQLTNLPLWGGSDDGCGRREDGSIGCGACKQVPQCHGNDRRIKRIGNCAIDRSDIGHEFGLLDRDRV
jgi:hypothetical protein